MLGKCPLYKRNSDKVSSVILAPQSSILSFVPDDNEHRYCFIDLCHLGCICPSLRAIQK